MDRTFDVAICEAPDMKKSVCFRIKVGEKMVQDYLSYHHAVTVILRALAINNFEILVSPGYNQDDFFLIMSEERSKETGWRDHLDRYNLEIGEQKTITGELFTNAIWYTIVCRMAPEWNRVGSLLVQGCDFLSNTRGRKYRAIELVVNYLPPNRIRFLLYVYTVSLNQLSRKDFQNEADVMSILDDYKGRSVHLDRARQLTCPVHVLPRETRGMIETLSKRLPRKCEFEDFEELREYWKQMYGYSLPIVEPEFYCEISFLGPMNTIFTYPNYCLLTEPMLATKLQYSDKERFPIANAFATDMEAKVPFLCGVPMTMIHSPNDHENKRTAREK